MSGPDYDLWYWPSIQGRGEFVRLLMEAAGITYRDRARDDGVEALVDDMERRSKSDEFAPYAPPYLVERESGFAIAQVAHIVTWLTDRHDLGTGDGSKDLHLIQLQLTISDMVAEVHNVHHPIAGGLYFGIATGRFRWRNAALPTKRSTPICATRSNSPHRASAPITKASYLLTATTPMISACASGRVGCRLMPPGCMFPGAAQPIRLPF